MGIFTAVPNAHSQDSAHLEVMIKKWQLALVLCFENMGQIRKPLMAFGFVPQI